MKFKLQLCRVNKSNNENFYICRTSRQRRVSFTSYYIEDSDEDIKPILIPAHIENIPKKWTCRKCSQQFPSRKTLTEHRKIHKAPERDQPTYKYDQTLELYVCSTCSAEFQDKEAAEKHILTHIETYTCETCSVKFSDPYKFSCHMQQHNEDAKFKCPMCTYATLRRTCIATHINRMHFNKFYYYCNTCGKGFNDAQRFKEHENDHLGIKPFICVVCNKAFSYSKYLQIHQIRYHTVGIKGQLLKNQCSICMRVFSRNDTLDKHMATRHAKKYPLAKKHLCDMCGKGFATSEKFKIHYRTHTGVKPFACKFCGKSFIKRDYLIMHERVHTGEKPYVCHYCGKSFNQGAPLKVHVRSHTGERPYICQFCNVGFVSRGSLNMHKKMCRAYYFSRFNLGVKTAIYRIPLKAESYKWSCKKCKESFRTSRLLRAHRKLHITAEFDEHTYKFDKLQEIYICNTCCAEYQDEHEIKTHMKTHEEVFICEFCDGKFQKAYDYGVHLALHYEDKMFRCPHCTYKTAKRTGLLIHINYVHLRKFYYVCKICGKGFNDVMLYKEHDNEHLGVRPFICVVCKKSFTYSRYLLTHQVRYHRVGIEGQFLPNQCTLCSKIFGKAATLQKHLQTNHMNGKIQHAKKHLCDLCGKSFAQKNKLEIHYRVHTGVKPYICNFCTKSFTKKDYLVLHERVHTGEKPYSCEFCGKSFSQSAPLRIHRRIHSGEKPYICHICASGFTSRGALNMHLKSCTGKRNSSKRRFNLAKDNAPDAVYRIHLKKETDKKWACKKCKKSFQTSRSLRVHQKVHVASETEEKLYKFDQNQKTYICSTCPAEYQDENEMKTHVKTHKAVFVCEFCDEEFQKAYDYGIHLADHYDDKMPRCPQCTYKTAKRASLQTHINHVHLKNFYHVCKKCGKGFSDLLLFKEHDNEHLGVQPFVCVVCTKSFTYSKYLLFHQKRYHRVGIEGQKLPNQCTLCQKIFDKTTTLEKHLQNNHLNGKVKHVKKHLCDLCGKGFAQKNKLESHYRIHTGVKPYTCSYCTKNFTKKDYLVMHERVHTGEKPYSCEFCEKSFSQLTPLRTHRRIHSGEKPYICLICSSGFTSRGALNIHLKSCTGKRK